MPQHHLVIPQTVQASHRFAAGNVGMTVVTHHLIPDGTSVNSTLADALFNSLKTIWGTNIAPLLPPTAAYNAVFLRDLRQANMPIVQSTTAPVAGSGPVADFLPPSIAAVVTVRTNLAGRKFRGRMYFGPWCETDNGTAGRMTTATKTALDAFAASFLPAANVSGLQLGVAHRPTAFDETTGLPISPGFGFTTPSIQVVVRDDRWDSQRRRNK